MLGRGLYSEKNKKLPGIYINLNAIKSVTTANSGSSGSNGTDDTGSNTPPSDNVTVKLYAVHDGDGNVTMKLSSGYSFNTLSDNGNVTIEVV